MLAVCLSQAFQEKMILGSDAGDSVVGLTDLLLPPLCSCNFTVPQTNPLFNTTKRMEMLSACHSCIRPGRVMLSPSLSSKNRQTLRMAHCVKEGVPSE